MGGSGGREGEKGWVGLEGERERRGGWVWRERGREGVGGSGGREEGGRWLLCEYPATSVSLIALELCSPDSLVQP